MLNSFYKGKKTFLQSYLKVPLGMVWMGLEIGHVEIYRLAFAVLDKCIVLTPD